jgi:hypothetical protein
MKRAISERIGNRRHNFFSALSGEIVHRRKDAQEMQDSTLQLLSLPQQ